MKSVAIIGGGAAGLMAAAAAGNVLEGRAAVTIFERKDRVGKKLLATGNGRGNLSNINAGQAFYHGRSPAFIDAALSAFSVEATLSFFSGMGLMCKTEYGGRVFPYSGQASAILDVLRNRLEHLRVKTVTDTEIGVIKKNRDFFELTATKSGTQGDSQHDCVIIACGGNAAPALGSNGSGFKLLKSLGHTIMTPVPALCQIKTDTNITKGLQGIKIDCHVTALSNGKKVSEADGEVLFTNYGLSGSAILDISRVLYAHQNVTLALDLTPEYSQERLEAMLLSRQSDLPHLTCEQFFVGLINKKIGIVMMKQAGVEKLSLPVHALTPRQIKTLTHQLKRFPFNILGHNGWDNAQVTAGGVSTDEFFPESMASKLVEGLYAAGEVLDIFGECGGFNLQWAWSSGFVAGRNAALRVLEAKHDSN